MLPESIPNEVALYRKEWVKGVPTWYRAWLHYLGTTTVSLPLVFYGIFHLRLPLTLPEIIMIPVFLSFAMLVEYITHRYVLHHRIWLLQYGYVEHTLRHHNYFVDSAIEATRSQEYFQVFFPVWGVALLQYGVNLPVAIAVGYLVSPNAGYIALIFGPLFFFIYETVHAICHLPVAHWIFKIPGIFFIREHHRIHHAKSKMGKYNFNVVFPLWDWILGSRVSSLNEKK